jgi:hypothetical protein
VKTAECCREQEVIDALVTERWPERVPGDLREHVEACAICSDLATAVAPILADREDLSHEGHIPSSAVMWWRAQMRARQQAARDAARPLNVAHLVGAMCALMVIAAGIMWISPVARTWLTDFSPNIGIGAALVEGGRTFFSQGWVLAMGLAWLLLLAPLAIYVAIAQD